MACELLLDLAEENDISITQCFKCSMFLDLNRRFEFILRLFRCNFLAVHTASTRSIHPRHPEPPISKEKIMLFPLPTFWGPIVRQISSPGRIISFSFLDIDCLPNLWEPPRVVANTLLYRPVLKLPQVLGRYLNKSLDIFQTSPKAQFAMGGVCFLLFSLNHGKPFYEIRDLSRKYTIYQISHICHENKKDAGRPYESFPDSSAPRSLL